MGEGSKEATVINGLLISFKKIVIIIVLPKRLMVPLHVEKGDVVRMLFLE